MTPEQAKADIAFLLMRSQSAGKVSFTNDRWIGMSSNALVALAYGGKQDAMPRDRGDYAACVRTYVRLPQHRKTPEVRAGLKLAREAYLARYPHERTPQGRAEAEAEFLRQREMYAKRRSSRKPMAAPC